MRLYVDSRFRGNDDEGGNSDGEPPECSYSCGGESFAGGGGGSESESYTYCTESELEAVAAIIAAHYSGAALDDYVAALATRAGALAGTPLGDEMSALVGLLCE